MIYHDQNKEDDRMLNDLVNSDKELIEQDKLMHESGLFEAARDPESYSRQIFQTGVHLSRIDPETGYDDYDPRDLEPPEEIYVSHDIGSISCARLVPDSTLASDSTLYPKSLEILQDARTKLLHDGYNNLAFWFLCDAIYYVITGKL